MLALVVRFDVLPDHLSAFDSLVTETVAEIAAHEVQRSVSWVSLVEGNWWRGWL